MHACMRACMRGVLLEVNLVVSSTTPLRVLNEAHEYLQQCIGTAHSY
jgi:hypothetical protein